MSKIFITGSADGLGQLAAKALIAQGHEVVLHARDKQRAKEALDNAPGAANVLTADLSHINETKELAAKVNEIGNFDAVIHNAGVYQQVPGDIIFAVNTLAPYILTCLIHPPARIIYLSSGMHMQGNAKVNRKQCTYSDSKLHDLMLSMAAARTWKDVYANAVDPGWVPTKMGGRGATGNLQKGYETQVWLAVSNDVATKVSGHYFHHKQQANYLPIANDVNAQNSFLAECEEITGVQFPGT